VAANLGMSEQIMAGQSQNRADLGMAEQIGAGQDTTTQINADMCNADLRRSEADQSRSVQARAVHISLDQGRAMV